MRANALEEAKSDMEIVHALGGSRIAAPPAGAQNGPLIDLETVAERYHALLEVGRETGVVPMLEVWGHSQNLHRLGQTLFAAAESSHPTPACCSTSTTFTKEAPNTMAFPVGTEIHAGSAHERFPAIPERTEMNDSHRVMPGDGVAPFDKIIEQLHTINPEMVLSLELFNRDYWKQDPQKSQLPRKNENRCLLFSLIPFTSSPIPYGLNQYWEPSIQNPKSTPSYQRYREHT